MSIWYPSRVVGLRERLGLTQEAFAERLGVRIETVNRWERCVSTPTGLSKRALDRLEKESRGK